MCLQISSLLYFLLISFYRRVRIWDNLGIHAQISPMRALPLQATLLTHSVPFTVRRLESELPVRQDFIFIGPVINS